MYGLTGEPLQTLYKIGEIFILLGVQLMATARARVRYVTVHRMAPNGPTKKCNIKGEISCNGPPIVMWTSNLLFIGDILWYLVYR